MIAQRAAARPSAAPQRSTLPSPSAGEGRAGREQAGNGQPASAGPTAHPPRKAPHEDRDGEEHWPRDERRGVGSAHRDEHRVVHLAEQSHLGEDLVAGERDQPVGGGDGLAHREVERGRVAQHRAPERRAAGGREQERGEGHGPVPRTALVAQGRGLAWILARQPSCETKGGRCSREQGEDDADADRRGRAERRPGPGAATPPRAGPARGGRPKPDGPRARRMRRRKPGARRQTLRSGSRACPPRAPPGSRGPPRALSSGSLVRCRQDRPSNRARAVRSGSPMPSRSAVHQKGLGPCRSRARAITTAIQAAAAPRASRAASGSEVAPAALMAEDPGRPPRPARPRSPEYWCPSRRAGPFRAPPP